MAYNYPFGSQGGPPIYAQPMDDSVTQDFIDQDFQPRSWSPAVPMAGQYSSGSFGAQPSNTWVAPRQVPHTMPIERFMGEQQRMLFTAGSLQTTRQDCFAGQSRTPAPLAMVPQDDYTRGYSPVPSNGFSSSISSAQSPAADAEFYGAYHSPAPQQDEYLPSSNEYYGQNRLFPDLGAGTGDRYASPYHQFTQLPSGVRLDQIQSFPDPQEANYDEPSYGADEGYDSVPYADYEETMTTKEQQPCTSYRHQMQDEGLGTSIHSEPSPQPINTVSHGYSTRHPNQVIATIDLDADADGDFEEDAPAVEEEEEEEDPEEFETAPSDEEYKPSNNRRKRSHPHTKTTTATAHASKRRRSNPRKHSIPKSASSSTNGSHACTLCTSTFPSVSLLQNHLSKQHTRPYICVFQFAGCQSTFSSKNEWKRHVSSQHLNLSVYSCNAGNCSSCPPEFNRKDLFTQHLRRMHAPVQIKPKASSSSSSSSRSNKENGKKSGGWTELDTLKQNWEAEVKRLQETCLVVKRKAPELLGCVFCGEVFEGEGCWDARMEHVGKHLADGERDFVEGEGVEEDRRLVGWAREVGIVERGGGGKGGWRLCVEGGSGGGGRGRGKRGVEEEEEEVEEEDEEGY